MLYKTTISFLVVNLHDNSTIRLPADVIFTDTGETSFWGVDGFHRVPFNICLYDGKLIAIGITDALKKKIISILE